MIKRTKKILGTVMLMVALICLACPAVFASDSVDIYTGSTLVDNLTTTELNNYGTYTVTYSTCKCDGTYYTYTATGPYMDTVLSDLLGTNYSSSYSKIEFIGSDSWTSGELNLADVLNGYYFTSKTDTTGNSVDAIIATSGDNNTLRDFFGQQNATDEAIKGWTKNLVTIVLSN